MIFRHLWHQIVENRESFILGLADGKPADRIAVEADIRESVQ